MKRFEEKKGNDFIFARHLDVGIVYFCLQCIDYKSLIFWSALRMNATAFVFSNGFSSTISENGRFWKYMFSMEQQKNRSHLFEHDIIFG